MLILKKVLRTRYLFDALSFFFLPTYESIGSTEADIVEILSTIKWLGEDQKDVTFYSSATVFLGLWVVGVHYSFWFQAVLLENR